MSRALRVARTHRVAGVVALVITCAIAGAAAQAAPAPSALETNARAIDPAEALRLSQAAIGHTIGDYTLRTSEGGTLALSSLRGKPVLISFIYTGCFQVCPTTTRTLKRAVESAQRTLGPGSFHVLSIGFNQPFDTPAAMAAFARQHGVFAPGWQFLSPDAPTRDALAREVGFTWREAAGGFDHLTQVTLLDQQGRVVRQIYGEAFALPQLVDPLKALLTGAPAANESLSGLLERVRILCTVYDPITGEYRYKTSILFEIAGGLIGLSLTAVFLRRELRKTRRQSARA